MPCWRVYYGGSRILAAPIKYGAASNIAAACRTLQSVVQKPRFFTLTYQPLSITGVAVDPASLASALGGDRPAQGQGPVPPCSPARGRYTVRRARVSARRWSLKAPAPTRKACGGPGERRPRRYGRGEASTTTAARRGRGMLVARFYYLLRWRPIFRTYFTEKRIDERMNAPSRRFRGVPLHLPLQLEYVIVSCLPFKLPSLKRNLPQSHGPRFPRFNCYYYYKSP